MKIMLGMRMGNTPPCAVRTASWTEPCRGGGVLHLLPGLTGRVAQVGTEVVAGAEALRSPSTKRQC